MEIIQYYCWRADTEAEKGAATTPPAASLIDVISFVCYFIHQIFSELDGCFGVALDIPWVGQELRLLDYTGPN